MPLSFRVFLPARILRPVAAFGRGEVAAANVLRRALATSLVRAGGLFRLASGGAMAGPNHVYRDRVYVAIEWDIVHVRYVRGLRRQRVVRYSLRDEV